MDSVMIFAFIQVLLLLPVLAVNSKYFKGASTNIGSLIALGAGTDVSIVSEDVVLMKSDLPDVSTAIQLSKAVVFNIEQNLFWAFIYNVIGIPLWRRVCSLSPLL
ncbi:MAG: hypothetical protein IJ418_10740 [Clostridia bacterium]|nr:hypothetical protein [Clostridia bacterium]